LADALEKALTDILNEPLNQVKLNFNWKTKTMRMFSQWKKDLYIQNKTNRRTIFSCLRVIWGFPNFTNGESMVDFCNLLQQGRTEAPKAGDVHWG
jgi:hypothetical protein